MDGRQLRSRPTRAALLSAGSALFAERGYAATTLDAIAEKAGVNRALVRYHFGSKKGLYSAILRAGIDAGRELFEPLQHSAHPPDEQLRAYVRTLAEFAFGQREFVYIMVREEMTGGAHIEPDVFADFARFFLIDRAILEAGMERGTFRRVDPHATHLSLVGTVVFYLLSQPLRQSRDDMPAADVGRSDYVAHVEELFMRWPGSLRKKDIVMRLSVVIAFTLGLAVSSLPSRSVGATVRDEQPAPSVSAMLEAFAADFSSDPMAQGPITFGILVKDADEPEWHVVVAERAAGASRTDVRLEIGFPDEPVPYYVTDLETLVRIHRGELASMTAMGKAFSTDFAPLDIEFMEGFEPTDETSAQMMRISFHFWTRGFPEVIRFGDRDLTRELHGGRGVLFYYQPGFRSGWFLVEPGQHVNADAASQKNPFPTLIICTEGTLRARIGGKELDLRAGETAFIGPDVAHEFWVTGDEAAEGVLLMFGEGA